MFSQLGQFPPLQRLVAGLERLPRVLLMVLSLLLTGGLVGLNIAVLPSFSFILLYLLPVAIASWFVEIRLGLAIALLCALSIVWLGQGSSPLPTFWNALSLWGILAIVASLMNTLKSSTEIEKQLLRTDPATGAINQLFFTELLDAELQRASRYRYALTLAILTLEALPQLRTQFGVEAEAEFLYNIVDQMSEGLRANDVVARLSADQFAILLPQTNRQQAEQVFSRLEPPVKKAVKALDFSPLNYGIAVTTFVEIPDMVDEVIEAGQSFAQDQFQIKKGQCVYQEL